MTSTLASPAQIRTAIPSLDQVISHVNAMGVRVSTYTMPASHRFAGCLWCNEYDRPAVATVYPRDESCADCCVQCLMFVTDKAITDSFGRSDYCSVEIAVIEPPSSSVVLDMRDRSSDLDDPRCEQHWSAATFVVQTEQHERGLYCDRCIADALRHALLSGGFMPGSVSAVDLDTLEEAAAAVADFRRAHGLGDRYLPIRSAS